MPATIAVDAVRECARSVAVRKTRAPWDAAPFQLDLSHQTLGGRFQSLSELSLEIDESWLFSPGQSLAMLHSIGILHGDLHVDHMLFDADTGVGTILDYGLANLIKELDPLQCATDFAAPRMSLEAAGFQAFVAGYMNLAETYLDSMRPGFSSELLRVLHVDIAQHAPPRGELPDIARLVGALGHQFSVEAGRVRLIETSNSTAATSLSNLDLLRQALTGMILCGIDCKSIARRIRAATEVPRDAALHGLIAAVLGDRKQREDPPTEQTQVSGLQLALIQTVAAIPAPNDGSSVQINPTVYAVLKAFLNDVSYEVRGQLVDQAIDVADALAKHCLALTPVDKARRISVSIAQHSLMLLQLAMGQAWEDEQRLSTMLYRSHHLDWTSTYLREESPGEHTLGEIAYATSRASALVQAFEWSVRGDPDDNPRWSTIWRCLQLLTHCLLALRQILRSKRLLAEYEPVVAKLAPFIARKYAAALHSYMLALLSRRRLNVLLHSWIDEGGSQKKLLESTLGLVDLLETEKIGSARVLQGLDAILTERARDRPSGKGSWVLR
jgi:hypothetical protein